MSFATTARRTLGVASVMVLALSLVCVSMAQAKNFKQYSLSGDARTQIGGGLPLPITFAPPPQGKVPLSGVITQTTTGSGPPKVILPSGGLHWGPQTATIPLYANNSKVFQIRTSLIVDGPHSPVVFEAGGRTGPPTFTWCPGQPLPTGSLVSTANPSCTNPNTTGTSPTATSITMNASIRYQKTVNQFGGVSQSDISGGVQLAIRAGAAAPCNGVGMTGTSTCRAIFSQIVPAPLGVNGGPIGNSSMFAPADQPLFVVNVDSVGNITAVGPQIASFPANSGTTVGAPWTTGKVTVSAPNAANGGEFFTLQGNDGRVSGVGSLSLVAGGVSHRLLSGDNANRGWLNYVIGQPVAVPSLSNNALIALAAILLASTVWMVRRSLAAAR